MPKITPQQISVWAGAAVLIAVGIVDGTGKLPNFPPGVSYGLVLAGAAALLGSVPSVVASGVNAIRTRTLGVNNHAGQ